MQITKDIHMVSDSQETVNAVFITTSHGTIVVDTMRQPSDGELLFAHVRARTAKPIRMVVNTHFHPDHVFGNAAFSAPIVATETTRALMKRNLEEWWQEMTDNQIHLPLPEVTFTGRMNLHFDEKSVHLHQLDGHAPGTVIVHIPQRATVYTSDLVFAGRLPFMADADLEEWIEGLRYLESLNAEHVIPGHGKPGGPDLVSEQREWLEDFLGFARSTLARGQDLSEAVDITAEKYEMPPRRRDMLQKTFENIKKTLA
ncbi:MAG: MBL fold metallo-hydrolase [Bacillota bacterium]